MISGIGDFYLVRTYDHGDIPGGKYRGGEDAVLRRRTSGILLSSRGGREL